MKFLINLVLNFEILFQFYIQGRQLDVWVRRGLNHVCCSHCTINTHKGTVYKISTKLYKSISAIPSLK